MLAAVLSIKSFFDFFNNFLAFLPDGMRIFLTVAIGVFCAWVVISLALKIIGLFL